MLSAPERIVCPELVLRPWSEDDAAALVESIETSRANLRPWMPWLAPEVEPIDVVRERHRRWRDDIDQGTDIVYGIFAADGGVLGSAGLHLRSPEPRVREIGYWTDVRHLRRGVTTTTAAALARVGLELLAAPAVEIHVDRANTASLGVARKLGFRHAGTIAHPPSAPSESGWRIVWRLDRHDLPRSAASTYPLDAYDSADRCMV